MNKQELSRIAELVTLDSTPAASLLTPEVRSGSSFTYNTGGGSTTMPAFLLVWFYTVEDVQEFIAAVNAFESAGVAKLNGVEYRGTYSVSISSPAPELAFRTYWALDGLDKLKELNDQLRTAGATLRALLDLIPRRTVMHSELMGLTRLSAEL